MKSGRKEPEPGVRAGEEPAVGPVLLTVREVAGRLRMHEKSIYVFLSQGRLPFLRIGGRIRIDARELDRWLAAHEEKGGPA